ncbi:MAG: GAF domain-containing protein [Chloroflexota bacterium]
MRVEQHLMLAWREHRLVNAINQVVFELDDDGRWTFLNAAWPKLSGFPIAKTLGSHIHDFVHPDDEATVEYLLQRARDGETAQSLVRLQTRDGQSRWVNASVRVAAPQDTGVAALVGSLVDATQQKAAEDELRQQLDRLLARREAQLSFAMRVSREFASGKPLDRLYDWFVNALRETFDYERSEILHYDHTAEMATLVASAGVGGGETPGRRLPVTPAEGVIGRAIAAGKRLVERNGNLGDDGLPGRTSEQKGSQIAAPIVVGGDIFGVLVVYGEGTQRLDEEDQLLLEGLAGQLATAIDSMQLRQEMDERLSELDNLQRLMRREAWLRAQDSSLRGARGYRFDRRLLAAVEAKDDEIPITANARELEHEPQDNAHVSPLQIRGEAFGALGVEDDPEHPLSADELALLDGISQQVSEALENARLLEQTQKRAVELETVSRVSTATSTILEKDKLLQGVVELTQRSFNLYHAHIYLLHAEHEELFLVAGSGEAGSKMVEERWRIELDHPRSIVAQAARARKGIIVNDVRKDTGFLPNPLLPATRSELAVPMISGNRLLGVLDVQSDVVNYFTQDDVRIQSALAGQVATALQNATLYQEQLETTEKLREFDRLKSEFLASMSHELRTPLNSIIGFADVLLEGIDGELNERMREDVQLIRNSGQHLRELIGDILDMSKIEAGMMDLRYEAIDVSELRSEIEGFARTQLMAYGKELDFKMKVGPDVRAVEADRTRFKQVLFNLVSNAIKFTAEGQVTLEMTAENGNLLVRVDDTGIGIKEENIPIIFEQFRQVDGSLTRTAGGTGLGLPISKSLVELHGGEIWVESDVGQGSSFFFTIPVERP